jgi:thiosulfate dehydrogenase [quinone] large subunit
MLVPLRAFLGVTFTFAGIQKLANPQFFESASPTSIHAQLVGATHLSPIHALISHLVPIAPAVGLVIALGEVAIGVGVLVGLWMRVAAVAGMTLSFGLFLTVSFHSSPYFTGSDIVFFFAWTPVALAGAAGAPAIDTWLAGQPATTVVRPEWVRPEGVPRRAVLSKGALTGAAAIVVLVGGGLAALLGRAVGGTAGGLSPTPTLAGGATTPSTTTGSTTTTTTGGVSTTAVPSGAVIGSVSSVPVGGWAAFTDPSSGDPALVIQQTAGDFVAFDAICPHQGCTVAYKQSAKLIACPCHGSEFNAKTGHVIRGPATYGLTPINLIKGANGNLYVPK